ncbi:MAG TPA: WecB/TagA/CpsF family glycosyltransferase [Trueperaceae bacterium]|nr:WecB/TagA/CpsF family glycosyltransferase [Trueperaceae bacterium]
MAAPARARSWLLGAPVDAVSLPAAATWVLDAVRQGAFRLVVTLNPEIVVGAARDPALLAALRAADLSVADGVGISLAARLRGRPLPGRVPGVDLVGEVLRRGGEELSVFFLGGRPGVAERAAETAARRYGCRVAGTYHGYFRRPGGEPEVCAAVAASGARLLLAGLGPGQERFLHEHRDALGPVVAIGVGGTLDVLAGTARRMPAWSSRLGVEWVLRVGLDPRRWRRVPNLLRFAWMVAAGRDIPDAAGR